MSCLEGRVHGEHEGYVHLTLRYFQLEGKLWDRLKSILTGGIVSHNEANRAKTPWSHQAGGTAAHRHNNIRDDLIFLLPFNHELRVPDVPGGLTFYFGSDLAVVTAEEMRALYPGDRSNWGRWWYDREDVYVAHRIDPQMIQKIRLPDVTELRALNQEVESIIHKRVFVV